MQELLDAVAREPLAVDYRWRLAAAYSEAGDIDSARHEARHGIRIEPSNAKCWVILGATYNLTGEYETAKACFDRALQIAPDLPTARWNRSWCNMAAGNWKEAWEDYEYGRISRVRPARLVENEWNGEDLNGKVVLVWGEQGFGDQIQFVRYVRFLREEGARVMLEVNKELVELFYGLADDVFGQPDDFHTPYSFDYHTPLLSLPYKLGKYRGMHEIPDGVVFGPYTVGEGVGLCWKGRATHPNDVNRSAKEAPGGEYTNLTYGTEGYEGGNGFVHLAETIAKLETVVTVDTAVAHLAGAMGKRVLMVPPVNNEGRWGTDVVTPWYSSMTLIRGHKTIEDGLATALAAV